jgi:saccharopine dehydrogenase-like NADP-dependent oxidoreductase
VRRIVVIGGRGFFGTAAAEMLRREGLLPLVASRRPGADVTADAEDPHSLRTALRPQDVVVDAAGPFQQRSTALIATCMATGCDVIDLADSLEYVNKVQALAPAIASAGVRVLTACSSVSTVSAALVQLLGVRAPVRVSAVLAPATRNTSTPATSMSLLSTLEHPVRVVRDGSLVERRPFGESRAFDFPPPIGRVSARLAESADAVTLPLVWPSLRDIDFWVDTQSPLLNVLLTAAGRSGFLRSTMRAAHDIGRRMTKRFGATSGGFGIDVEDANGLQRSAGFFHASHSYIVAVAPAVLAARKIAAGTFDSTGLVPADRHVDPWELVDYLRAAGIKDFGIDGSLRMSRPTG